MVYGSAPETMAKLGPVHNQGPRLNPFSPVESLYVEAHEPSLEIRKMLNVSPRDISSALSSVTS